MGTQQGSPQTRRRLSASQLIEPLSAVIALVLSMWLVFVVESLLRLGINALGVRPREFSGLLGIITAPFLHHDFNHILSNTIPLIILGSMVFYWSERLAAKACLSVVLVSGFATWLIGKENSVHIGASGLVYGLAAFAFFSGIFRREAIPIILSILTFGLYAGMLFDSVLGIGAKPGVSWEMHTSGAIAGTIAAWQLRKEPHR